MRDPCIAEAMHRSHPSHKIFISHLAAAAPLLETDNISPVCYRDMSFFDGLYLKKLCSAGSVLGQNIDISFGSVLGQNIDISFGPNGAPLGAR